MTPIGQVAAAIRLPPVRDPTTAWRTAVWIRLVRRTSFGVRHHVGMRFVDLSHVSDHQMITYPGLPGPEIGEHLTFDASHDYSAAGTEFAIGRITMVANTGTYLDTPAHRFRDGHDLSGLPLEHCADLPTVVVDGEGPIGAGAFSDVPITACPLPGQPCCCEPGGAAIGVPSATGSRTPSPHRSRRPGAGR